MTDSRSFLMRGRIVLVPFPFDDLSATKVRPALCLTDPIGIHRHVVVAFISSVVPAPLSATDLILDPGDPGFALTGLRVRSVVCVHRLMTVSSTIFRRTLGDLTPAQWRQVEKRLRTLFGV